MAAVLRSARVVLPNLAICRTVLPRLGVATAVYHRNNARQLHSCTLASHLLAQKIGGNKVLTRSVSSKDKKIRQELEDRVLKTVKKFDRLDPEKLTVDSHFINDLGLDSLDHVEIIMMIEDEFMFEIPDDDAERLMTPKDIVQYIGDKEDVYD